MGVSGLRQLPAAIPLGFFTFESLFLQFSQYTGAVFLHGFQLLQIGFVLRAGFIFQRFQVLIQLSDQFLQSRA